MLSFQNQSDVRTLVFGDRQIFSHSPEHPFAIAIKREKTYEADRGTVKETVTEVERVPLTEVSESGGVLMFSANGHSLSVAMTEQPDSVQLDFTGVEFSMTALFTVTFTDQILRRKSIPASALGLLATLACLLLFGPGSFLIPSLAVIAAVLIAVTLMGPKDDVTKADGPKGGENALE